MNAGLGAAETLIVRLSKITDARIHPAGRDNPVGRDNHGSPGRNSHRAGNGRDQSDLGSCHRTGHRTLRDDHAYDTPLPPILLTFRLNSL